MAGPYQPHQGTDPYPSQPLPYPETSGALSPAPSYPGTSYPGTSYPGTSYPGDRTCPRRCRIRSGGAAAPSPRCW